MVYRCKSRLLVTGRGKVQCLLNSGHEGPAVWVVSLAKIPLGIRSIPTENKTTVDS